MYVLDHDLIESSYDVLVIGAGIGGLTAAALLAKRGFQVLVIEQHYVPGGCASIFRRQGFTFDVGASLFFGFGEQGYNPHQFVMNELGEDISLVPMEETFTIYLNDGRKVAMVTEREQFIAELHSCFPHHKEQITELLTEFETFYTKSIESYGGQFFAPAETPPMHGVNLMLNTPLYLLKLLKYLISNQDQLFRKYIDDPHFLQLFDLLNRNITTCGLEDTPAIAAPMIHVEAYTGGCYYAHGSPQMLANKLEKAIHKYGGQILYRHQVDQILIEQGQAVGCKLTNGVEIKSKLVISNTTIWNLYGKLIDPQHIAPKKLKWAKGFKPTYGVFAVYLGVKAGGLPEDIKPTQIYPYVDEAETSYLTVYVTSLLDPSASPPGTHTLLLFLPEPTPDLAHPTDGSDRYHTNSYRRQKKAKAAQIIDYMQEHYFPDLKDNILVQEIATPQTLQRYTLKSSGGIGGPQVNMRQSYMSRLAARSDWKNLYCVGDSTSQGIGVVSVTVSAISAVNAILEDIGHSPYKALKQYPKNYVHFSPASEWRATQKSEKITTQTEAKQAAIDCQLCQYPRCARACPAHIDTGRIARLVEADNLRGAARALRDVNPLSEITGYVCPAEDFCERRCSRLLFDSNPVPIKSLHRYVCEQVPTKTLQVDVTKDEPIAIVGAGPAGLTCAYYLARLGYRVDIYEKRQDNGGMIRWMTHFLRVPKAVVDREIDYLLISSIRIHYGQSLGKEITLPQLQQDYSALFLACGLGGHQQSSLTEYGTVRMTDGLSFLESCVQDSTIASGRRIAIVGATFLGTDLARTVKDAGAKEVRLLTRKGETLSNSQLLRLESLQKLGIEIQKEVETSQWEDLNRDWDQVVVTDRQAVESKLMEYLKTNLGLESEPWVDSRTLQVTGKQNVFAGGDMIRQGSTVVEAVRDGRIAAQSIHQLLQV